MYQPWTPHHHEPLTFAPATDLARSTAAVLQELTRTRPFLSAAGLLGLVTAGLIGTHVAWWAAGADRSSALYAFALDVDGGLPERFEYALSFAAAALLLLCARMTAQSIYAVLCGVHAWLLLDNALHLHERLGWEIKKALVSQGLPSAGESLVFLAVMITATLAVGSALVRAPQRHRALGLALFAAAGSLVVFAVGVDLVHAQLAQFSPTLDRALALLEDGGELVIFALNAAVAFAVHQRLSDAASYARAADENGRA